MDILCKVHVNIDLGNLIRRAQPDELSVFSYGNSAILRLLPMLDTCLVYSTPPTTSRLRSALSNNALWYLQGVLLKRWAEW